jgi:two-component system cell cycle response regulator CpdR
MPIQSIMVVDDDLSTLGAMQRALERSGYTVSSAAGGREAIRMLGREPVDLVVTDIVMPEGDGLEVIAALRKNFPTTRIIAMSGGGRVSADDYLLIARGYGVDVRLKKPFSNVDLLDAVRTVEKLAPPAASRPATP